MNTKQLKCCPFCGNEADTNSDGEGCDGKYYLSCMGPWCGAEGPVRKTLNEAIDAWNQRSVIPGNQMKSVSEDRLRLLDVTQWAIDNYDPTTLEVVNRRIKDALEAYEFHKNRT